MRITGIVPIIGKDLNITQYVKFLVNLSTEREQGINTIWNGWPLIVEPGQTVDEVCRNYNEAVLRCQAADSRAEAVVVE